MKTEIFDCILKAVADVTELSQIDILSTNKASDIVEARALVIHFGKRYGLSNRYLQLKLNRKSTYAVRYLAKEFYSMEKSSFSFREAIQQAGQIITNKLVKT